MKKYLLTLPAMLMLLVAGCEMFPPDESQIAPEAGPVPGIAISTPSVPDSDSTFSVTITPAEGTGFYAYLVTDTKSVIDGSNLLGQGYEGLATGLVDMAVSASVTLDLGPEDGIMPGSLYYVYAVAGSKSQGIPSEVAYDSVYTTNSNVPIFDDDVTFEAATNGSYVDIALNDVIRKGSGKVYYTVYNAIMGEYLIENKEVTADSILTSGKIVRVNTPADVPNGAYVNITWDEGAFVNSAGTECQAYTVCDFNYGDGIIYRKATVAWRLSYTNRVEKNDKGEESLVSTSNDTLGIVDLSTEGMVFLTDSTVIGMQAGVSVTYSYQNGNVLTFTSTSVGVPTDSTVMIRIPAAYQDVEKGTWMSVSIPAGAFIDRYGNPNAAFTSNGNFIHSYGYTMNDLYGTYQGIGYNAFEGAYGSINSSPVSISPIANDDEDAISGCNVVIENLIADGTKVYAAFGKADGLLHIPAGQTLVDEYGELMIGGYRPIYGEDSTVVGYETFPASLVLYSMTISGNRAGLSSGDITLQLTEPGVIENVPDTWINYLSYFATVLYDTEDRVLVDFEDGYSDTLLQRGETTGNTASVSPEPQHLVKPEVLGIKK